MVTVSNLPKAFWLVQVGLLDVFYPHSDVLTTTYLAIKKNNQVVRLESETQVIPSSFGKVISKRRRLAPTNLVKFVIQSCCH